jgi:hypothetical protein
MVNYINPGMDHGYYDEDDMVIETGKKAKYEVNYNYIALSFNNELYSKNG